MNIILGKTTLMFYFYIFLFISISHFYGNNENIFIQLHSEIALWFFYNNHGKLVVREVLFC